MKATLCDICGRIIHGREMQHLVRRQELAVKKENPLKRFFVWVRRHSDMVGDIYPWYEEVAHICTDCVKAISEAVKKEGNNNA